MPKCYRCAGTGRVFVSEKASIHQKELCPVCRGSGQKSAPPLSPGGEVVPFGRRSA